MHKTDRWNNKNLCYEKNNILLFGIVYVGMLCQTRATVDRASPLLPFPFRNDAMRANVGSGSGWNAATAGYF